MSFMSIHIEKRRAITKGTALLNMIKDYVESLMARVTAWFQNQVVLDKWAEPFQQYMSFKRVGLSFLVVYIVFVFLALRVLQREHLSTPVPGTYVRHTYTFKPRRPEINITTGSDCHANEAAVLKPYFYRLDEQTFFINAFFDKRHGGPYIRVLSLRRNVASEVHLNKIYCLVNDARNHSLIPVTAEVHMLHDNTESVYGGYILTCNVRDIVFDNPCKVRLSYHPYLSDELATVPLVTLQERYFYDAHFGVCTPPIYNVVTQNQLVEFIELQRLLGAEHVFFYLYMGNPHETYINPNVEQVLRHYISTGFITVQPWQLPIEPRDQVWSHAKALAIQHCLYTNMWRYKYLVFNDLDEFVVPHQHNAWPQLMEELDRETASGYCAQSAYFPPDVSASLKTLGSFKRTETINTNHIKCIVRPERVLDMGSEGINKAYDEVWPMTVVDPEVALVHHYKFCTTDWDFHNCFDYVTDECTLRYDEPLRAAFRRTMLLLSGKSPDQAVTTYTNTG